MSVWMESWVNCRMRAMGYTESRVSNDHWQVYNSVSNELSQHSSVPLTMLNVKPCYYEVMQDVLCLHMNSRQLCDIIPCVCVFYSTNIEFARGFGVLYSYNNNNNNNDDETQRPTRLHLVCSLSELLRRRVITWICVLIIMELNYVGITIDIVYVYVYELYNIIQYAEAHQSSGEYR